MAGRIGRSSCGRLADWEPAEVVRVSKVDARVQMDAVVLDRVDALAAALGSSRDQVIENSVRRSLAAVALSEVLGLVRERIGGGLAEESATDLAYSEVRAARAERAASPGDALPRRQ